MSNEESNQNQNNNVNYNTLDEGSDPEISKVVDLNNSDTTSQQVKNSSNTTTGNNSDENINENNSDESIPSKIKNFTSSSFVNVKSFFKKAIGSEGDQKNENSTTTTNEEEGTGILAKADNCRQKALKYMQEKVEVETDYKIFMILISIGTLLFCVSLFFIPILIISPRKFVSFFSLGSLFILVSFLFVYGTKTYFEKICSKERFVFTTLFFGSILLGIFCAILNEFFVLSIICAAVQLLSLIVFILNFIPGGQSGISAIQEMVASPFRGLWSRITG
jgi:hypothetical protein